VTAPAAATISAVVVGCSAGGLRALQRLLGALDSRLPVPVIIVCHTGSADVALLCELLGRHSRLPVCEARERYPATAGVVHLAASGYHLLVERDGMFALSVDPKICFVRPSIDVLFQSAADAYGSGLAAVILTGANEDGAAGLRRVRERGGIAVVQDPADAEAPEMPAAALMLAGADHVLPLEQIPSLLNRLCGREPS
jgi:two-component system chemotaxis response regulator CheB